MFLMIGQYRSPPSREKLYIKDFSSLNLFSTSFPQDDINRAKHIPPALSSSDVTDSRTQKGQSFVHTMTFILLRRNYISSNDSDVFFISNFGMLFEKTFIVLSCISQFLYRYYNSL